MIPEIIILVSPRREVRARSNLSTTDLGKCEALSEVEFGGWLSNLQLFFTFSRVKSLRPQLYLRILWENRACLSPRYEEVCISPASALH